MPAAITVTKRAHKKIYIHNNTLKARQPPGTHTRAHAYLLWTWPLGRRIPQRLACTRWRRTGRGQAVPLHVCHTWEKQTRANNTHSSASRISTTAGGTACCPAHKHSKQHAPSCGRPWIIVGKRRATGAATGVIGPCRGGRGCRPTVAATARPCPRVVGCTAGGRCRGSLSPPGIVPRAGA